MPKTVEVISFRAAHNIQGCLDYNKGRNQVLIDYGFESVVSEDISWFNSEDVIIINAYLDDIIVAGVKLNIKKDDVDLPLESTLNSKIPFISTLLKSKSKGAYAEFGGIWNAKRISQRNFTHIITRYGYGISKYLGLSTLYSFIASYTYKLSKDYGGQIISEIGDNGWIKYPTDKYKASIWIIPELENIKCANLKHEIKIKEFSTLLELNEISEDECPDLLFNYKNQVKK